MKNIKQIASKTILVLIVISIICLFSAVYGQDIQSNYSDEINDSVFSKEEIFVQYPVRSQDDMNLEQYIKWTENYVLSSEETNTSFTNKSSTRGLSPPIKTTT